MRTWNVTRFRGMISTQPGSTPLASFNVVSLESQDTHPSSLAGNVIGECVDTVIASNHSHLIRNYTFVFQH